MDELSTATVATPLVGAGEYRRLMANFPTGVVAVTAVRDGQPVGLIVGSFFSASLTPCLVGLCVARSSVSWPLIEAGRSFSINMLAADQEAASVALSARTTDKFAGLRWTTSANGSPVLNDALAHLDCELATSHDAGDHVLVIAGVHRFTHLRSAAPLVFYQRGYRAMADPDLRPAVRPAPTRTNRIQ